MVLNIRNFAAVLAVICAAALLAGCSAETEQQLQRTADEAASEAEKVASETGETAESALRDMSVAARLTPKIKQAIVDDDALKDDRNQIDVDTTEDAVYLRGRVVNQYMKNRAEKIAKDVIQAEDESVSVKNELYIGDTAEEGAPPAEKPDKASGNGTGTDSAGRSGQ